MILSKHTSSGVIITYMRLDLGASLAVHSTCSLLSLRFFDVKVSVFPIYKCIMPNSNLLLLEAFIKVSNELVTFQGEDSFLL